MFIPGATGYCIVPGITEDHIIGGCSILYGNDSVSRSRSKRGNGCIQEINGRIAVCEADKVKLAGGNRIELVADLDLSQTINDDLESISCPAACSDQGHIIRTVAGRDFYRVGSAARCDLIKSGAGNDRIGSTERG